MKLLSHKSIRKCIAFVFYSIKGIGYSTIDTMLCNSTGAALLCECDEFCPDNHFNNFTCATNEGYCFAKLHYVRMNKTIVRTHGCTADTHDGGIFQCRHKKHENPTVMMCCKDVDYCNSHLRPTMNMVTDHNLHKDGMLLSFHYFWVERNCFFAFACNLLCCSLYFNLST